MKIWQLLDSRSPGGIETHVLTLCAGLRSRGVDARVMFLADHGPHPLRSALSAERVPWAIAGGAKRLARALWRSPPDLMHTHGYKAGILGRLIGRATTTPVVSSFHAGEPGEGRMRLYAAIDRLTAPLAVRIAVSPAIAASLSGPVELVPNFVRCPTLLPTRPERRPAIGFVGRLSHEKGPDLFFDLAARLHDRCDFIAFGDGPMRAELAEHPGAAHVTMRGFVPSMNGYWGQIDLMCLSSRHEGLPMAVLEAMAHGCPVAGFAVGAMRDVVEQGRTGHLARPGDLDGLAAAIRRWLDCSAPERLTMSENAIDAVRSRFGLEAGVDRMLSIYAAAGASFSNSTLHQSSGA